MGSAADWVNTSSSLRSVLDAVHVQLASSYSLLCSSPGMKPGGVVMTEEG